MTENVPSKSLSCLVFWLLRVWAWLSLCVFPNKSSLHTRRLFKDDPYLRQEKHLHFKCKLNDKVISNLEFILWFLCCQIAESLQEPTTTSSMALVPVGVSQFRLWPQMLPKAMSWPQDCCLATANCLQFLLRLPSSILQLYLLCLHRIFITPKYSNTSINRSSGNEELTVI